MSEEKDLHDLIGKAWQRDEERRKGGSGGRPEPPRERRPQSQEPRRDAPTRAAPQQQRMPAQREGYRFLNPYNFVRYLKRVKEPDSPETQLLTRCEPPPHDRYVGLTGRIRCEVTAVTPLFISDSHEVRKDEKTQHKSYRFFQYDGQDAIPASSLRGMIRSVFEAATNSCFGVFEDRRLSYRLDAANAAALVPARVEKHGNEWRLRLLTGLTALIPGERPRALYAATVNLYEPIRSSGKNRGQKIPPVDLKGVKHGEPCWALVDKRGIFTYVKELGRTREELPRPRRDSERVVQGWLCINNQNIENKRKERFFFRAPDNAAGPTLITLRDEIQQAYKDLIADYQENHKENVHARLIAKPPLPLAEPVPVPGKYDAPALSRYMYDASDLDLQDGTLVYVGLSRAMEVEYIAPAAVPRVSYDRSIGDLLKPFEHLCTCTEYKELCPACRVFGWVYDPRRKKTTEEETRNAKSDEDERTKTIAYAGRLRFSHAELLDGSAGVLDEDITLAILSSPKPTTTRFYLMPENGQPRDGLDDEQAGYDSPNILRGRKFYRHQVEANPKEYIRPTDAKHDGKDEQNRTVRGARKPGNKFTFTIDFHNLAPVELGALLWTLELGGDEKLCHRLGFAKPLGFGSVKIKITDLKCVEPGERYKSLNAHGGWHDSVSRKVEWEGKFQHAMRELYGKLFEELENVRDLRALLGEPPDLPIHYPRSGQKPDPEGKNFEWFVGNKRKYGPKKALRLADQDQEGLPLISSKGATS